MMDFHSTCKKCRLCDISDDSLISIDQAKDMFSYQIGDIYTTFNTEYPGILLGYGTWERIIGLLNDDGLESKRTYGNNQSYITDIPKHSHSSGTYTGNHNHIIEQHNHEQTLSSEHTHDKSNSYFVNVDKTEGARPEVLLLDNMNLEPKQVTSFRLANKNSIVLSETTETDGASSESDEILLIGSTSNWGEAIPKPIDILPVSITINHWLRTL